MEDKIGENNQTRCSLNISFNNGYDTTVTPDPRENDYIIAGTLLIPIVSVLLLANGIIFIAIFNMIVVKRDRGSMVGPVLILNLTVADGLVGISSLLTLTEIGNTDVDRNFTLCLAMVGMMSTPCVVSFLIMTAIAVDRYLIIFKPFRNTENEIRKTLIASVLIWAVSSLIGFAPSMGWNKGDDEFVVGHCHLLRVASDSYILFIFFVLFLPIVLVSFSLYCIMCQVSRKHRRRIDVEARNLESQSRVIESHANLSLPHISEDHGGSVNYSYQWARSPMMTRHSVFTVDDSGFSSRRSSQMAPSTASHLHTKNRIHSERFSAVAERVKKISTAAPLRNLSFVSHFLGNLKHEKGIRTLLVIMGCFVVMWTPYLLTSVIQVLCGSSCDLDDLVATYFLVLGVSNSAINPVVYVSTDQRLKKYFCRCLLHAPGAQLPPSSVMYSQSSSSDS